MDTIIFELFWFVVFAIVFAHLVRNNKSLKGTLLFFVPAIIWSYAVELTGVHIWSIYTYSSTFYISLWQVPISIALGWATLHYVGFQFSKHFSKIRSSLNVDIKSASLATFFDFLILEPIAYVFKFWVWKQNDFWFGAPMFNFIGWFLMITLYLVCYQWVTKRFTSYRKRVFYLSILLVGTFILIQLIAFLYAYLFGKFL